MAVVCTIPSVVPFPLGESRPLGRIPDFVSAGKRAGGLQSNAATLVSKPTLQTDQPCVYVRCCSFLCLTVSMKR